jgi:basic membrane protein A and related proteins
MRPISKCISVAAVAAAMTVALGCGSSDGGSDSTGAKAADVKVRSIGVLLPGKTTDPGYTGAGYAAAVKAAAEHGAQEPKFAESVDVSQAEEAFRTFASGGADLVVGWGGQFQDAALKVAEDFPETTFVVTSGAFQGNDKNFASANFNSPQWTYLMGYVMGRVSKSHKIGYISGTCFPALEAASRAMDLGARRADPQTKTTYVGLKSFEDPAAAKQATLAMIAAGADVISTNLGTGNAGVFEAARSRPGTLVTTNFTNQVKEAPNVILTGTILNQEDLIGQVIAQINDGTFKGKPVVVRIKPDEEALVPLRGLAPESVYKDAKELQAKIASGEIKVPNHLECPYG